MYKLDYTEAAETPQRRDAALSSATKNVGRHLDTGLFLPWYSVKQFNLILFIIKSLIKARLLPLKTQCLEKFGVKWGTECFNTGFSLPTLLCAEYSVKLIYLLINNNFMFTCTRDITIKRAIHYNTFNVTRYGIPTWPPLSNYGYNTM